MTWLYLYFDRLLLDMLPVSIEQPMLAYNETTHEVIQYCERAAMAGVRRPMNLTQAQSLCQNLYVITYRETSQQALLQQVATQLYQVVSDIVIDGNNGLAIRLDPMAQYYGGLLSVWSVITQVLAASHLHYHFSTAWTIEAARVLALNQENQLLLTQQEIKDALTRCPLSFLSTDKTLLQKLSRTGFNTIGQLIAMPVTEIGRRFDNALLQTIFALRGERPSLAVHFHPKEKFEYQAHLDYYVEDLNGLLPWISQQLDMLESYLYVRSLCTRELKFCFWLQDKSSILWNVKAAEGLYKAVHWQPLVILTLAKTTLLQPVTSIKLNVGVVEQLQRRTGDFFQERVDYPAQSQLISTLAARLGEAAIQRPLLPHDHRFEASFRVDISRFVKSHDHHWHPAFIFTSPRYLSMPSKVVYGPVRIHTGWWDNHAVKRDYFIATTEEGINKLVFREGQSWFIHGLFS